jgi:hypothetical protein
VAAARAAAPDIVSRGVQIRVARASSGGSEPSAAPSPGETDPCPSTSISSYSEISPQRAGHGDTFTCFHAEAGIAAEHCFAPSFAETRWNEIAKLYAILERIDPSPFHSLNRAVAVAQGQGPHAGLAALEGVVSPTWLDGHYCGTRSSRT